MVLICHLVAGEYLRAFGRAALTLWAISPAPGEIISLITFGDGGGVECVTRRSLQELAPFFHRVRPSQRLDSCGQPWYKVLLPTGLYLGPPFILEVFLCWNVWVVFKLKRHWFSIKKQNKQNKKQKNKQNKADTLSSLTGHVFRTPAHVALWDLWNRLYSLGERSWASTLLPFVKKNKIKPFHSLTVLKTASVTKNPQRTWHCSCLSPS